MMLRKFKIGDKYLKMSKLDPKILREAMDRTEFTNFFRKGLKKVLLKGYASVGKPYEKIVTFETSDRDIEYYPALGGVPEPDEILEGEEYKRRGIVNESVSITNRKYGDIMEFTRELIMDEQTRAIKQKPREAGEVHARGENNKIFTLINNGDSGTNCYDGQDYFDTAGHPDVTGGTARAANTNNGGLGALSETNLETALAEIALWRGRTGEYITALPTVLLVAPNQLFIAKRLMHSTAEVSSEMSSGVANVHQGTMEIVVAPWLTASTWYIKTNIPGFIFQWREKLRLQTENVDSGDSFLRDVYRYKHSTRFGYDIIDWRVLYKGN